MAIVKEITINLNDDDAKKGLKDIDKLFKDVEQSEQKAVETTKSLRTQLRELQQAMASGQLSGAEFREASIRAGQLRDAIGDANARINALASDTGRLDALMSAGQGIAGAFSTAQGALALFGNENEEVQQAILKVQGSMALLNGVQAVANTLNKDSALMVQLQTRGLAGLTGAQALYTTVVGTSTGAMKLFRIALVSTGVGALVVGLGLLIANFESISKWVTDLIDKFGGWRKVLMFVAPPIWAIVKALEAMGIIDDEATAKAKENAEERIKASQKQSKELDKQKQKTGEYYDFEIRKAQASGGNVQQVEHKKRLALLETLKTQNELERSWIRTNKATQDDIKRWNERQKEIAKINQDIIISNLESQKSINEEAKKRQDEARKLAQENTRKQKEEQAKLDKERLDALEKIRQAEIFTDEQKQAEELRQIREHYKNLILEAEKYGQDTQTLKEALAFKEAEFNAKSTEEQTRKEAERRKAIEDILKVEREETKTQQLEREQTEKLAELERLNASETEKNALRVHYMDLIRAETQKNQDAELEREKLLQAQKIDLLGNSFGEIAQLLGEQTKAGKAFAIAQALINTYQGISNVWAEKSESGLVGLGLAQRILTTGIVAAKGFATVKKIMSVSASGGGGGGSMSTGGGGGAPSVAPVFNTIGGSPVNQLAQAIGDQPPVQAFVVGSQVTSQQALDRNIIQNASLG
jgi:hypothetical protein